MVKRTIPIILAASFLLGGRVYANSSYEYTPVMPRVNSHRIYIDNRGLEKYTGNPDRAFKSISRENIGNGTNRYLTEDNSVIIHDNIQDSQTEIDSTSNNEQGVQGISNINASIRNFTIDTNAETTEPSENDIVNDSITNNTHESGSNTTDTDNAQSNNVAENYAEIDRYTGNGNISNGVTVKPELISAIEEVGNYKVNGSLPHITNIRNAAFAVSINEKINESYLSLVRAGYRNINVDYDVFNWGNITSIVIRYRVNNEKETVKTFVFDSISQTEVTLRQLLGKDYMEYANRYINEKITKSEIGVYYAGLNKFSSIAPSQNFYIKDGQIVIVFDQYSIGPASTGTPEFQIPLESLSITLSSRDYVRRDGNIYIPISAATRLGMSVNLGEGGILEITPHNSTDKKSVNVNNKMVNSSQVIYINGYDIGLSADYMSTELGIIIESNESSQDLTISYMF